LKERAPTDNLSFILLGKGFVRGAYDHIEVLSIPWDNLLSGSVIIYIQES